MNTWQTNFSQHTENDKKFSEGTIRWIIEKYAT